MKTRFVVILVALNAAVLAAGYILFGAYWNGQMERDRSSARTELEAWKARASAPPLPAPPAIVYRTNTFDWSKVESDDYRQYIANLRAVGCPEITVRDIIMTDVMRLYAQRRGQYSQNGREFKFWETDEKRVLKQAQEVERDRQLAQINKDLPAVLRELLGINYEREMARYFVDTDQDSRRLAFLPEDKRERALALRDKFEGEREAVTYNLTNGVYSAADIQKLKKIDEEQETALAGLLTPAEKEDYQLSLSPTADHLRKELIGFNPTEEEFRTLFRRQQAIDATYAYLDMSDPAIRASKASDEQVMMNEVKTQLGPDRATALDRAKDPDYQSMSVLAERFDLPSGVPQTMADIRQTAEDEKQQLIANKNIPIERLQTALKAIQDETEKAARQTLGDAAFGQYSQSANWIRNLGGN
jgi:hypothetical protein